VPKSLSLFSCSEGSLAAMIDHPTDREPEVRAVLEAARRARQSFIAPGQEPAG
jgi:hypothetical protein